MTNKIQKYDDFKNEFTNLGFTFKRNELTNDVEVNGTQLDDALAAVIRSSMRDRGFPRTECQDYWTRLALENSYHPMKEYFTNLEWDGTDYFSQLMSYLKIEDQEFGQIAFRKFMIGAISKLFKQTQNFMLIFDGKQGIGKSHLAEWLCPLPAYFNASALHPEYNDHQLKMLKTFLWEVNELQHSVRRADAEALKAILTVKELEIRQPYGRVAKRRDVPCSFVGTVNDNGTGFLNDPTGSRRFVTVNLLEIDWNYSKINRDQLWAQVFTWYGRGEAHDLSPAESQKQRLLNDVHRLVPPTVEQLTNLYVIDPDRFPNVWTPVWDIMQNLMNNGITGNQKSIQMEVAGEMARLGVPKSRSKAVTGQKDKMTCYQGVVLHSQIPPEEDNIF